MALGAKETAPSILFSSNYHSSPKFHSFNAKSSLPSIRLNISLSALKLTLHSSTRKPGFQLQSAVESVAVTEDVERPENRRKLFVLNLPWSFSVADIKKLFGECGAVDDVEIIKQKKDGKNRGFAFVTMASAEEAQAAIENFDSHELTGRIIRVQFSRRFKKPIRTVTVSTPPVETRHKLYVSNLAWKVRSNNLREFFSANFNPVSARVVFGDPSGKSAGYGFVSFATKEEAESAISALDGKELMGRPIRLKFSEKNTDTGQSKEEESSEEQSPQES